MELTLHHYWRSTTSWRVRWVFALKGLSYRPVPVSLLNEETNAPDYRALNPQGYVPTLQIQEPDGHVWNLTQSIAICEWAEEIRPDPAILPIEPELRARVRALVGVIASDTHPLQNLTAQELHSSDPAQRKAWAQHWIREGLAAYESLITRDAGLYSVGDTLTLADICLSTITYNAHRQEVSLAPYPRITEITTRALATPAAIASHPDRFQP